MTELAKKLKMQGISKGARHPMFQGRQKDVSGGNFSQHCCYTCGNWFDCEMSRCTHAVCVRIGPCCDPRAYGEKEQPQFGTVAR